MTDDTKTRLAVFYQTIEMFYGRRMTISECISLNGTNFDRHFSTLGHYEFKLEKVSWRMSGGRMAFSQSDCYYEISIDNLVSFSAREEHCFEFLEKYSESVFRMTTIKFKEL